MSQNTADRQRRVAATFISRYFELLIVDPQQLVPMYLPKASFSHDGSTKSVQGPEAISKALARLYPQSNHGRIIVNDMSVRSTERSRFAVVVSGKYLRREGRAEGEPFRHVLELQEHADSNGVFAIYADTRHESKQEPLSWALETPPMDAKPEPTAAPPALVQPPTTEAAVAPTPAPVPAAKSTPVAKAEKAPAAPPAVVDDTPKSFAEMLRNKPTTAPTISKATVVVVAGKKEEAPKEAAAKKGGKDQKKAPKAEGEANGADKKKDNNNRSKKSSSNNVKFDIVIKGLAATTDRKAVQEMFVNCPVSKVQLRSHADRKDETITRTFALVLLDHEAIGATAFDSTAAAAIAAINTKYGKDRIQAEIARDKQPQQATEKQGAEKKRTATAAE